MPTYQNTAVTQVDSPWYGSAKVEVSLDGGSTYTNVGVARGVVFNEVQENNEIQADNGPDLANYLSKQTVELTLNSLEVYLPTYNKIRGGIDTLVQVSTGSTTAVDSYSTGATSADKFIKLVEQGTGTTGTTIASVKQLDTAGDCTTLTVDVSYTKVLYGDDLGIILLDAAGTSYQSSESVVISYGYHKVASNRLSSGGLAAPAARWYRLTNIKLISGVTKYRYIYIYSAFLNGGMNLAFKSDNDADPVLEAPLSILGKVDTTRTAGDQLFLIDDQQGVA
jgi:hypothetical protein